MTFTNITKVLKSILNVSKSIQRFIGDFKAKIF